MVPDGETCLLLGVDGGGTHTRAVVADTTGRLLGQGGSGTANQATSGAATAVGAIMNAVQTACARAGCRAVDIAAACFGLAGLDRPGDEDIYAVSGRALDLRRAPLLVNDAVIAWAGAAGGRPGVALIAGTGSVAYGRDAGGREHRAGGWGGPFGDEGSAFWIGTEAVRRVLRGLDARDAPAGFAARIAAAAGFSEPADLCRLGRLDPGRGIPLEVALGALAPAVVECAEEGDVDAQAIVGRAGRELADLAGAVVTALSLAGARPAVYGLGSVLYRPGSPPTAVARATSRHLQAEWGLCLQPPVHSALVGALILAYEMLAGRSPMPDLVAAWSNAQ